MQGRLFEQTSPVVNDYLRINPVPLGNDTTFNDVGSEALQSQPERLKVASYCRVSTLSDPQEESLENQIIHYTNYIRSNSKWEFAGIFSDQGKSGTKTMSRTGFNKMVRYALDGKIDVILCKSISRFARNVLDTLDTVRLLKENGVKVIFERENIDTGEMQSEFILTMLAVTAQEESRSISDNATWSVTRRFERGDPIFVRVLGYTKDEAKAWIIVEEEAKVVKEAFDECLKGKSLTQIAKMFIRKGYKKANGRRDWSAIAVRDILKNERYTGDVLCQKTYTKDHLSQRRMINDGTKTKYLIKEHHEPIVGREIFNRVQQILARKTRKVKKGPKKTYPLSGRLVCAECGGNLQRFLCRGKVTWRCGNSTKSKMLCNMTGIREENILKAIMEVFKKRYQINKTGPSKHQSIKLIKELLKASYIVEAEQNQLRLELERALQAENAAIINCADTTDLANKRTSIEEKIAVRKPWWDLIDKDDFYKKEALDILEKMKSMEGLTKESMQNIYNIKFLRAWVVRVKAISPFLFSITWVNGDETEVELREGESAIEYKDKWGEHESTC
ncbi:DNA invertase Pin-like site-specific DNA recombinase [Desulfitispora alkaliphila]|uniref:recombinase family protein n=1 Tax=Desulfitispora alkaliphila TaxID=622674 RepID=UPI003D1F0CDE